MPRLPRIISPNCLYHVICRGNNQQNIFLAEEDFLRYLWLLQKYKTEHPVHVYHYVLMTNHLHMLLEPSTSHNLSALMKKLDLTYTHYFQKKYGGIGHLWHGRFKSILVAKDSYCLTCAAYIELNPVAAGMVQKPEEYPWSSYRFYAFGEPNAIITKNPLYDGLGHDEKMKHNVFQKLVEQSWVQKKFKEEEMDRMRYFGSGEFVQQMEKTTGLPNIPIRGRPKK